MTAISRMAGQRSGRAATSTRPARSSVAPALVGQRAAERRGRPRRRPRSPCGRRAAAVRRRRRAVVAHAVGIDAGRPCSRCAPRRRAVPAARVRAPTASARRRRARGPSLRSARRARGASRCGGTRRGSVWCAISVSVPAISTPVGPPPMTTKVSQALALRRVGRSARRARRRRSRGARIVERVGQRLQPRRMRGPVVVAEVAVGGAGGDDQVVVGERVSPSSSGDACARRRRCRVTSACSMVRLPRFISRRSMWRIGALDRRRRQPGRGDLVQQRLEQVVVGAVDQRDLDRRPSTARAPPRCPPKPQPIDDDARLSRRSCACRSPATRSRRSAQRALPHHAGCGCAASTARRRSSAARCTLLDARLDRVELGAAARRAGRVADARPRPRAAAPYQRKMRERMRNW